MKVETDSEVPDWAKSEQAFRAFYEWAHSEISCVDGDRMDKLMKPYDHWGIIHSDEESSKN